jgi:gliding motility-associated-like protein
MGTADLSDDIVVQSGSATTLTSTNTAGGSFTINVYDSNGCVGTANAVIPPYDELLSIAAQVTRTVSCNPGMDGEITVLASTRSGDMSLLEYSLDGGLNWQITPVFSGLITGTYTLLVRHRETGCVLSQNQTLDLPEPFSVVASVIQDQSCYGTSSGAVTLELQDASYNGGFDWVIYQTNGTPSDLSDDLFVLSGSNPNNGPTPAISLVAGTYRVSVTQVQIPGCSQDEFFAVNGPEAPITAAVALSPISCALNDGIIEIYNVNGGSAPYQFYVGITPPSSSSEFGNSPRFENVPSGVYQAWILDGFGCQTLVSDALTLTNPEPITANLQINQENCTEFQGEIEVVNVTGGMGSNYVFQLLRNSLAVGSPQSNPVFAGLGEGTYEVRITDPMGCETIVGAETLYSEINLSASVISGLRCDNPSAGAIDLVVQGGSTSLEFTVQYPDGITVNTNNTGSFTGLSLPGVYVFTVFDLETGSTCFENITVTLAAPSEVVLEAPATVNVSCNGVSDGSIRANLSQSESGINDNPIYNYALYNQGILVAGPQVSPLFEGLSAGDYQIEAISAQGCSVRQFVSVTEPNPLTLSSEINPFTCDSGNTSSESVLSVTVPSGAGTSPYLYSLDGINYQNSNTFIISDTGSVQNLTVYVLDSKGCSATEDLVVNPLNRFTLQVNELVALTCANSGQLQISISDDGNPANAYSFELLPMGNPNGSLLATPSNNQAVFEVLNPGNYVFRVTDRTSGCWVVTEPFEIPPYDILNAQATPLTSSVCYGDAQGSVSLSITNYIGNYSYEVFNSGGLSTGISGSSNTGTPLIIEGLNGGMYYVQILETDSPFCQSISNSFTISSAASALSATVAELASVTCTDNQGELSVIPQGGFGPYTIAIENTATGQAWEAVSSGGTVFTQLKSGNYTIRVTDALGCEIEEQYVLSLPAFVTANAEASPAILECFGDTNGVVTAVQVAGGSGSYQYQLHSYDASGSVIVSSTGFQTSPVFSGLGSGIYSITVSDGWSCDIETGKVSISEPSEVFGSLIQLVAQSCEAEAQLELRASGGTGPYQYSIDGIQFYPMSSGDTHTFTVDSGSYQYYVRDSFGCGAQISNQVEVEPITPLSLLLNTDAAVVNCSGESTASISANAIGGLGEYLFTLYTDASLTNSLLGPQASGIFNNLGSGSYWIKVTSVDCEAVSEAVLISEPQPLVVEREEVISASCSGEDDGTITVEVSGGTGNIQYAISPNLNQFDVVSTFTGLAPGTYQVIAQDSSGCFMLFDFEISEPEPIEIIATATPEVCTDTADGMVELEITGGQAPYWTALNSNQSGDYVQDQMFFSDLTAGTHVIFVRDSRGCESNTIITIEPGVNLNATVTPVYSCTGEVPDNYLEVALENASLSDEVMYALDSTDPADMQLTPDFRNITPGSHYLAISHVNGCLNTISFEINDFEGLTLTLDEGNLNQIVATAQGGNPQYQFWLNDEDMGSENSYYISESGTYTVRVMDQNGCVAEAQLYLQYIDIELPDHFSPNGEVLNELWMPKNIEAYPNILIKIYDRYGRVVADLSGAVEGWDGTYNGKPLPTGDYWYVIQLNGAQDDREFFGHFTLYR